MEEKDIDRIERYLRGELEGKSLSEFEKKLAEDETLARELEQQRQADALSSAYFREKMMEQMMAKGRKMLDKERHKTETGEEDKKKIVQMDPNRRRRRRITWMSMAASILVIVAVAAWQFGWLGASGADPALVVASYYGMEGITSTGLLSPNTDEQLLIDGINDFKNGNYKEALLNFNELLARPSFEQKPRVLLLSGIAHTELNEPKAAVQRFRAIPTAARTYYLEGKWREAYALWKDGNEVAAKEIWTEIAGSEDHPRQFEAKALLANL